MYRFSRLRHLILSWKTKRLAKADAKYKVGNPQRAIDRFLSLRPAFDPIKYPEHAGVAKRLLKTDREKHGKELVAIQQEIDGHTPAWYFTIGLIILFFGEYLGASLIFKDLGYAARERAILGLMLAAMLFFLTWFAAHMATRTDDQGRPIRSKWLIAVLVAYTFLVLSVAIFRHSTIAVGEESSAAGDIATSVLMVFTSIGPAWLGETLMRKREPIAKLTRMRRHIKQRLAAANRDHDAAEAFSTRISRLGQAWDAEHKSLHSTYVGVYEQQYTKLHGVFPPPFNQEEPHQEESHRGLRGIGGRGER
jgi:hypothetical protein